VARADAWRSALIDMPRAEKSPSSQIARAFFAAAPGLALTARLFDRVADIVFCIKDRTGRYMACNDAFVQRVGLKHTADVVGRTAREFFPEQIAAVFEAQDREVIATGRSVADKLELSFTRDGSLGWFLAQKEPVKDAAGKVIGIVGISRDLRLTESDTPRIAGIGAAVARIRRDYASGLRIAALARESGLSSDAFERRFRKALGLTAREFLLRVRVEEAARRLRETGEPLASIASACGFYDQSAFTRHFRAITGLTPSVYRGAVQQ
jgi:PAS domain S-box-containing protein